VTTNIWVDGDDPKSHGWYAIAYCWEMEEGSWCEARYYKGEWNRPVYMYCGPFVDESSAAAWAKENDISF